jgi:hypothetical protein
MTKNTIINTKGNWTIPTTTYNGTKITSFYEEKQSDIAYELSDTVPYLRNVHDLTNILDHYFPDLDYTDENCNNWTKTLVSRFTNDNLEAQDYYKLTIRLILNDAGYRYGILSIIAEHEDGQHIRQFSKPIHFTTKNLDPSSIELITFPTSSKGVIPVYTTVNVSSMLPYVFTGGTDRTLRLTGIQYPMIDGSYRFVGEVTGRLVITGPDASGGNPNTYLGQELLLGHVGLSSPRGISYVFDMKSTMSETEEANLSTWDLANGTDQNYSDDDAYCSKARFEFTPVHGEVAINMEMLDVMGFDSTTGFGYILINIPVYMTDVK